MSESSQQFRSAAFGGFKKQDVLNYIETSTKEHTAKLETLQKELDEVKKARAALESEKAELTAKLENTSKRLEETAASLERTSAELESKRGRVTALEGENSALKASVDELKPDADAYHKVKDRTAGIELDAHCRAQAAEAAAQGRIKKAKAELEQWMLKVQSGYDRLRTDVDATISHAAGELERVKGTLGGISGEFSIRDTELEQLVKEYRDADGPHAPMPLNVDGK